VLVSLRQIDKGRSHIWKKKKKHPHTTRSSVGQHFIIDNKRLADSASYLSAAGALHMTTFFSLFHRLFPFLFSTAPYIHCFARNAMDKVRSHFIRVYHARSKEKKGFVLSRIFCQTKQKERKLPTQGEKQCPKQMIS